MRRLETPDRFVAFSVTVLDDMALIYDESVEVYSVQNTAFSS